MTNNYELLPAYGGTNYSKQTQSNPIYGERSRTIYGEQAQRVESTCTELCRSVEPFRPFEFFTEIRSPITFKSLLWQYLTKNTGVFWCTLEYLWCISGVLLNHFGCVLITFWLLLMTSDFIRRPVRRSLPDSPFGGADLAQKSRWPFVLPIQYRQKAAILQDLRFYSPRTKNFLTASKEIPKVLSALDDNVFWIVNFRSVRSSVLSSNKGGSIGPKNTCIFLRSLKYVSN